MFHKGITNRFLFSQYFSICALTVLWAVRPKLVQKLVMDQRLPEYMCNDHQISLYLFPVQHRTRLLWNIYNKKYTFNTYFKLPRSCIEKQWKCCPSYIYFLWAEWSPYFKTNNHFAFAETHQIPLLNSSLRGLIHCIWATKAYLK